MMQSIDGKFVFQIHEGARAFAPAANKGALWYSLSFFPFYEELTAKRSR